MNGLKTCRKWDCTKKSLTHVNVLSIALSAVGMLGVSVKMTVPFAVLGATEAAGAALTELAIVGLSAKVEGGGAIAGMDWLDKTGNVCISDNSVLAAQRPVSVWRTWVASQF